MYATTSFYHRWQPNLYVTHILVSRWSLTEPQDESIFTHPFGSVREAVAFIFYKQDSFLSCLLKNILQLIKRAMNLVLVSAVFCSKCQLSCSSAHLASKPSRVLRPLSPSTSGQRVPPGRPAFYVSAKRIQAHAIFIFSLGQHQEHNSCLRSVASPHRVFVCFRSASSFPREVKQTHCWHNEWN